MFKNTTTHSILQLKSDDSVFLTDAIVMFPYAGSSIQNANSSHASAFLS
jgi:hypothetical protein